MKSQDWQLMSKDNSNRVVPKLRFPEFRKDVGWKEELLGDIASFSKGKGISKADISPSGTLPCIRYGELYTHYQETIDTIRSHTNIPSEDLVLSQANDVIIPASGETQIDIAKASCVLKSGVALGGDLNIIRSEIHGVFLSYYLNNAKRKDIAQLAQGISVVHLNAGQLAKLRINTPEPKEQQKIADCLSSLDDLITAEIQKLEALKAHKKGLLQNLFPVEGETVPKLRFPEFQGKWDMEALGPKTTKIGSGITPSGGDRNYKKNGRPFVRSQNVGWGQLILDDIAFIDDAVHLEFAGTEIKQRDVLLNITGASIGRCATADDRIVGGNVNQHVCIIRAKSNELNPEYLKQYLLSRGGQNQIDSFQAGGNRQGLNFAQIRLLLVPIPPNIKEQQRIADILASIDDIVGSVIDALRKINAHKNGLMQQLFPHTIQNSTK